MRVLINVRSFEYTGGVVQIFKTLEMDKIHYVNYFTISNPNYPRNPIYLLGRYFSYFFLVRKYDIVHLNPSFKKNALWRDLIFLRIAKFLNKKAIT